MPASCRKVLRASRMSSLYIPRSRLSAFASAGRNSAAAEGRLAALVEGADAFATVFGRNQTIIGLDLEGKSVRQRHLQAAMDGLLGLAHRQRTVGRDAARDGQRRFHQSGRLGHAIDEAP